MCRLLWTFIVRGAGVVDLQVKHGPPLNHTGGETVWKALLTEAEVAEVEAYLQSRNLTLERLRQSREDIRQTSPFTVSSLAETEGVYKTVGCPLCFFFHPQGENQCGVRDWPPESVKASLSHPKCIADLDACTLQRGSEIE